MPEWKQLVRERLQGLKLDGAREVEIVDELSQHLEDRYDALRSTGGPPTRFDCSGARTRSQAFYRQFMRKAVSSALSPLCYDGRSESSASPTRPSIFESRGAGCRETGASPLE